MKIQPIERITKTGKAVSFRNACEDDARMEIDYLKRVCDESPFLLTSSDEVTYTEEGEREYIRNSLEDPGSLLVNAYLEGRFVGNGSYSPVSVKSRMKHRASLGIALFEDACNDGIGEMLLRILLENAKSSGYEIMELDVYAKNVRAIHLYEKLGFTVCGAMKKAVRYKDGNYDDLLLMQKFLQEGN